MWSTPAAANDVSSHDAHWGALLTPDLVPTRRASLQVILLSEYARQPSGATRRGTEILADRYGGLKYTYGMTYLSYSTTGYMYVGKDRRSPSFLYTVGGSLGAVYDPIPSFFQNQVAHNLRSLAPVPRDGEEPQGLYGSAGAKVTYLLQNDFSTLQEPEIPMYIEAGGTVGSFLADGYLTVGLASFRPLRWGPLSPYLSWLTVHTALRAGFTRGGFGWDGNRTWLPGLSTNVLKEFYAMYQMGLGLEHPDIPFSLTVSYTGSTGIFVEEDVAGRADREKGIPENFVSAYLSIGNWWFEFLNDLLGSKDFGPSYAVQVGGLWNL